MPDPINWGLALPYYSTALLFGYLLGSIPFGFILSRLFGFGDIRKIGSGNIGATNALRTGNKLLAALTLLGDALKGTLAVWIASHWGPDITVLAALGAFLGHLFPIWLKFSGGKGAATFLGILLVLHWLTALIFIGVWILTGTVTRYSSLASMFATVASAISCYYFAEYQYSQVLAVMTALLWCKHHSNIRRLFNRTENKIWGK